MLIDRSFEDSDKPVVEESDQVIADQVEELTKYVELMSQAVGEMEGPVASTSDQLPEAIAHLGELAKITEEGTHKVMSLTEETTNNHEQIKTLLSNMTTMSGEELASQISLVVRLVDANESRITNITVALGFQDIVAQRVAKLVTVLDEVQHKLLKLVIVFGLQKKKVLAKKEGRGYEMLQQLEASKNTAIKQDLVDDILSEFGFN